MNRQYAVPTRRADSLTVAQAELAGSIARWIGENNQLTTAILSLTLCRWETTTEPTSYMHPPSICLIAQGSKRVMLGEDAYLYDANHFLITSVDLPVVAQIIEASREKPYLGLTLELDQRTIAQLLVDSRQPLPRKPETGRAMAVSEVPLPLLNAFQRLIDLLDAPEDIPILVPLVLREIFYRLLVGEQGARLRQITTVGSHSHQIARAIDWLKDNFNQPLRVDDLAAYSGMSTSSFYHHFRSLTAMSPLQFQKRLRLNEARRLMLTKRLDAATASFQVGYESPSQFSREYHHLFGAPPLRDIKNLHQVSA
ncbi:AraC family transcriptional regulator [Desulforhabdus amnigena]|jgi:AraC-like DNA-binding protein|uniref:AraC family transcriptional regulator n=1 Tax=Desulforhabdus amnigena TaxID=40218 RepID=A0A9W6L8E2_9BACT|nr:AraC family transcriptional regulator [Desulforhabdus amnigena]NLJ29203.1 AraC family transcriptional regulator [Deltaproteobacteria bacterium]GLI35623.1 AraC family transcriptional regulator [Desulforhabdus amnigena]